MILTFYDKDLNKIANNTALIIDRKNFKLIKRPIELNDFSCVCESFTEDVNPTFLAVYDDIGRNLIYSALAGVPEITLDNKTQITASDLKILFNSDVILNYGEYTENNTIKDLFDYLFNQWKEQVNQGSFAVNLEYLDNIENIKLTSLLPTNEIAVYNVLDEISTYLSAYNLYIDSDINFKTKIITFKIGEMLSQTKVEQIRTWEYGLKNYGKFVADINEIQGYYNDGTTLISGSKWILTSNNEITTDLSKRDIYPIKRRVKINTESLLNAEKDALIELLNSRYNENLEISSYGLQPTFSNSFDIFIKKNNIKQFYKRLPLGELRYNYDGLYEIQIGLRYLGL